MVIKDMDYLIDLPVSEDFQAYGGILFVDVKSKDSHKIALENMALYFKREFSYDWSQYDRYERSPECVGFLFVERAHDKVEHVSHHPHRVIGGGCFREKTIGISEPDPIFGSIIKDTTSFNLDWVWLHPFARNRRIMRKQWNHFKDRFGIFTLSEPLSPHMQKFMEGTS